MRYNVCMTKLVIFDCDGVLVDSEYEGNKVFVEVVSEYGYSISLEECIKRFTGVSEHDCRKILMEETGLFIPEDYWANAKGKLTEAYKTSLVSLMEPVLTLLEQHRIPRCVASNSSQRHVIDCLQLTGQLDYFSEGAIFSSRQVAKPKPAPDLFLFAANQMGVSPKDCIVVEDSVIGGQAAIAAGMEVFFFLGGRHAGFESYQSKVAAYNKPMFSSCDGLQKAIIDFLKK